MATNRVSTTTMMVYASCILAGCIAVNKPSDFDSSITLFSEEKLRTHVEILASDELEGRGAGYQGEEKAALYIADQFSRVGLGSLGSRQSGIEKFIQPFSFLPLGSSEPWATLTSRNVVGVLPGTDPEAGYIVVGGHFDGQGMTGQAQFGRETLQVSEGVTLDSDDIWNSAVDNAVSIAAIIEIAEFFSDPLNRPKRSIIFVAFGAEESSLDGSIYFANNLPDEFGGPRAMINLEKLVGHEETEFLYVSYGTSPVFEGITDHTVNLTGLKLTPFYPGVIPDTDHYAFIMAGIPAVTIGTGAFDYVHTAYDNAENLDYTLLAKRTNFVTQFLLKIANVDSNFRFTGDTAEHMGATGGAATPAEIRERGLGDTAAFKVASIVHGSRASKAGLLEGDLVTSVNVGAVKDQRFYLGLEDLFSEPLCGPQEVTVHRANGTMVDLVFQPAC